MLISALANDYTFFNPEIFDEDEKCNSNFFMMPPIPTFFFVFLIIDGNLC